MKLILLSVFVIQLFTAASFYVSVGVPVQNCDSIPELNKKVLAFTKANLNKKVQRGECWDLAAEALKPTGAKWDGRYVFGREVDHKKECVYPGDIVQFDGIKLKYEKDGVKYTENMIRHTAVIYEVKGNGIYTLAHQNTQYSGRKVGLSSFDIKHITSGRFKIYRPVK